jgi:hypothetical protein
MPQVEPTKIAYLFGAGATNAELSNIGGDLDQVGLLISDVTRRVTIKAKQDVSFLAKNRMFLERASDSSNIELFISLIENNAPDIEDAARTVDHLKDLVEKDIKEILNEERSNAFYLHKALFELHANNLNENIVGVISLNYDTVLDDAYKLSYGDPDYSFSPSKSEFAPFPVLKLHGSFNWNDIEINGRRRKIPIIPVGINKNYLRLPYNFIWGRALGILASCDILRVIGCSLSQNDSQLIDLLFKAHIEKGGPFEIQLICPERAGVEIKSRYDFFPRITTAIRVEDTLMTEVKESANVFMEWLKAKGGRVLKEEEIRRTTHLKRLIL